MSEEIKILDIIQYKATYGTQTFLITNRCPKFLYEKRDNFLVAEDGGFFNFYEKTRLSGAFCSREFEIPMLDGSSILADGHYWDYMPEDYYGLVNQQGYGTVAGLAVCNVFCSVYVDIELVENWFKSNSPSNNYDKYRTGHENYGKRTL